MSLSKYLSSGVALSALMGQPLFPAHAETFISQEGLEEVVVYGAGYRTTGTKSELSPLEAPLSYEVYDAEVLELRQVDSINEAMRYVPGITPESRGAVTIFDQYTIRGFVSYNNYYDGLPLQYNRLWNLLPQVDAFATQSVEVLKGPISVLYGSAPPGGMINQVGKQPLSEEHNRFRGRVGTDNLVEVALDSTGPVSDSVDYRIVMLYRDKDGQQVTTKEERLTIAPSLTWQVSDRTSLNLNLYFQNDPEMVPSTPLPALGTLYDADYGRLESDAYAGDQNWAGFDREVLMVGYKLNHEFNENVSFLQNFRYTNADGFQKNTYNYGLAGDARTLIRSAYFTDEENEGVAIDNQLAWRLDVGQTSHRLLLGMEYQKLKSDIAYGDTLAINTPTIDLGNPDHDQFDPDSLPLDSYGEQHDIDQEQFGIYLQDEITWGNLTVLGGLRWDTYESSDMVENVYLGFEYGSTTEIDQDKFSARVGAIYTFDNGLAPYVSYAESFEPTSGVDSLTGEAFKPTTAKQFEIGIKFRSADGNITATAAYFDLRKQNVVVNTPDFLQYTQTGEVKSQGLELSVVAAVTASFDITANFTELDVVVSKNELNPALVGLHPVWVADRQASLWATWRPREDISVNAGVRHVGESQLDALNTDVVPAYTVFDAALSWQVDDSFRLGLNATNLTDKSFIGSCYDANNCWFGAERSIEFTLYADF